MRLPPNQPQQLPLDMQPTEELLLRRARQLFAASRYLGERYARFEKLMADPVMGRCMRMWAAHSLRSAQRTRGR